MQKSLWRCLLNFLSTSSSQEKKIATLPKSISRLSLLMFCQGPYRAWKILSKTKTNNQSSSLPVSHRRKIKRNSAPTEGAHLHLGESSLAIFYAKFGPLTWSTESHKIKRSLSQWGQSFSWFLKICPNCNNSIRSIIKRIHSLPTLHWITLDALQDFYTSGKTFGKQ